MNFELFVSKTLLLFLIDFRWLLFYWIGVVLVGTNNDIQNSSQKTKDWET
jgi:hypothetical protein